MFSCTLRQLHTLSALVDSLSCFIRELCLGLGDSVVATLLCIFSVAGTGLSALYYLLSSTKYHRQDSVLSSVFISVCLALIKLRILRFMRSSHTKPVSFDD